MESKVGRVISDPRAARTFHRKGPLWARDFTAPRGHYALLVTPVTRSWQGVGFPSTHGHRLRLASRLLLLLAALQVFDLVSTLMLLSIGGTEANPVAAWLLGQGTGVFVAVKLGLAIILAAMVPLLEREKKVSAATTWTCLGFDAFFGLAVVGNLVQFVVFA